jgi:hypothetical protein
MLWRVVVIAAMALLSAITVIGGLVASVVGSIGSSHWTLGERVAEITLKPDELTAALEKPLGATTVS